MCNFRFVSLFESGGDQPLGFLDRTGPYWILSARVPWIHPWLANPADNQGWAFISDDSHIWGFMTSMDDKPAEHPKLVVVAANCP